VPPFIVGTFERLLVFILVLLCADAGDTLTVLSIWLGLKLASSWQPLVTKNVSRGGRVGTLTALMTGIFSVSIGAAGGWLARWGCDFCQ
jgi:hypothetical protein